VLGAAGLLGCAERAPSGEPFGLDCVFDPRAPLTACPHLGDRQSLEPLTLSDSAELCIQALSAARSGDSLSLEVRLAGRFWNETDQNLYVFLGAAGPASPYALSADPGFAAEVGYPVRGELLLPHGVDLRVGVMAPAERVYSPQVYLADPVHADAVGPGAIDAVRAEGSTVHLTIPLGRYYAKKNAPVPEHLGVTVASARDYVGFVDQRSVRDLPKGSAAAAGERDLPPIAYPLLDPAAHRFAELSLRPAGGGVSVELTMAAPITDWAQTNLHFFFVPTPPYPSSKPLPDPSKSRTLPYKWSYYCGVYSPRRIFCKASHGKDFTFDKAYAERASLSAPPGVSFRELGAGRYALEIGAEHADTLRAGRPSYALVVSAGRDGFGPTSWYGARR
jgi:hypothetical protein